MPHKFTVGNASLYREGMDVKFKSLILKAKIGWRQKPRLGIAKCQDMAHWFSCDEAMKQDESGNQGLRRGQRCALISASETSMDKENFVENYQRCERAYAVGPAFEVMTPGSADYVSRYRGDPRIMTGMQDKSVGSFMEFGMTPGNVRIRRFQLNANARATPVI